MKNNEFAFLIVISSLWTFSDNISWLLYHTNIDIIIITRWVWWLVIELNSHHNNWKIARWQNSTLRSNKTLNFWPISSAIIHIEKESRLNLIKSYQNWNPSPLSQFRLAIFYLLVMSSRPIFSSHKYSIYSHRTADNHILKSHASIFCKKIFFNYLNNTKTIWKRPLFDINFQLGREELMENIQCITWISCWE